MQLTTTEAVRWTSFPHSELDCSWSLDGRIVIAVRIADKGAMPPVLLAHLLGLVNVGGRARLLAAALNWTST